MSETTTIFIVGDWVVDEYWCLVGHKSDLSSHAGPMHYRSSNDFGEPVRDLCGAGHVARVLHDLRAEGPKAYDLAGLGNWDIGDEHLISHLFHKTCSAAQARYQFRLEPGDCSEAADIKLICLDSNHGTTRIVRLYGGSGKTQIGRIDWELSPNVQSPERKANDLVGQFPDCRRAVIVVYDLHKGVLSTELVCALASKYPEADWYVKSKLQKPKWLKHIADRIKLMLIGPEVGAIYNPIGNWVTSGRITRQGMEILRGVPGKSKILLSSERQLIARLNSDVDDCITEQASREIEEIAQVGWASAVFASLIHTTYDKSEVEREDIDTALKLAQVVCAARVSRQRDWSPLRCQVEPEKKVEMVETDRWAAQEEEWKQATEEFGIIQHKGEQRLEVWRGWTDLPGYIALAREKRQIVESIGRRLRAYKNGSRLRPLNILLEADPGAGKTSLAKSLARVFSFSFIGWDLTQVAHRDELFDLFDSIATRQAGEGDNVLVFVDEVNAPLGLYPAYGTFLKPLEDGTYLRRGQTFSLKPCIWVFAGTGLDIRNEPKGSDFLNRMTSIERLNFGILKERAERAEGAPGGKRLLAEAKLEQLYLGATMIREYHPDVQRVSKEVLLRFYGLDSARGPARVIRKRASLLRNVQHGDVRRENWDSWDEYEEGEEDLSRMGGKEMVRLVFD